MNLPFFHLFRTYQQFFLLGFTLLYCTGMYWFYYQKIAAFGCFDDCFNYGAGYFITHGKKLYTDLFFNHQPLMAYLSAFVQTVFNPQTLYEFLAIHRLTIYAFSLLMSLLIVYQFGIRGAFFVLLYEPTKFYVFGDRFLAEAIIAYMLVYLFGLGAERIRGINSTAAEIIIAAFLTWFVVFSREPFVFVALFLYAVLLSNRKFLSRKNILSFSIFAGLSLFTVLYHSLSDYIFNVYSINANGVLANEIQSSGLFGTGILKIIGYPVYLLIHNSSSFLKTLLTGYTIIFLAAFIAFIIKKYYVLCGFIVVSLTLANIRYVEPGQMYYESFHQAPWYALFIFATIVLLFYARSVFKKILFQAGYIALVGFWLYSLLSPQAFFYDKLDKNYEFSTNYATYYVNGEVIKRLASPGDTLFVDGFDELIHWQADVPSPYKYTWYTSFIPDIPFAAQARIDMFKNTPPTFYYGSCPKEKSPRRFMPQNYMQHYETLYFDNKPSCIKIIRTKIPHITQTQWNNIKTLEYYLPNK